MHWGGGARLAKLLFSLRFASARRLISTRVSRVEVKSPYIAIGGYLEEGLSTA